MLWCTEVLQCVVAYCGCIVLYRFWLGIPVGFNFECPSKNAYVNGFYDKTSPKSTAIAYAAHMHANEIPSHTNRHKLDESNSYLLAFYCYTKSNQSRLTAVGVVVILLHSPAYIHRAFSAGWRLSVSLSHFLSDQLYLVFSHSLQNETHFSRHSSFVFHVWIRYLLISTCFSVLCI